MKVLYITNTVIYNLEIVLSSILGREISYELILIGIRNQ